MFASAGGVRHAGAMRLTLAIVLVGVAACAARPEPTLVWEGSGAARVESLSRAVDGLPPATGGVRRGPWGDSENATMQLLETVEAEQPHVHALHDLTVVLLAGRGTVVVEGRRHELRAGDVLHIGRGRVHALEPAGRVIGVAIFTPRLEAPDYVPESMPKHKKLVQ